jgi:hypothetical protein
MLGMSVPDYIGRYQVGSRLGAGGFAVVWLAHDASLDTSIAIKVMAENWADHEDLRTRFLGEARMLRRTASHRVVQVFDLGELPDGRPYFVMDFADRGTLADRLKAGPIPLAQALRMTAEIARGVADLHRAGIVHRDIKPSNVLIKSTHDGQERLMIADLGIAKNMAEATSLTMSAGSVGYMAPEQNEPTLGVDVRADVYSLGALAAHAISGQPPGLAGHIVTQERLYPNLPKPVRQVLTQALELRKERRWPDATSFAVRLDELADQVEPEVPATRHIGQGQGQGWGPQPGAATPAAPPRPPARRSRPFARPALIAGAAAVALLAAGFGLHQSGLIGSDQGLTAAVGETPTPTPSTAAATAGGVSSTTSGAPAGGCAKGGGLVPEGANQVLTADLDGDGLADNLWLADVGKKHVVGVRTASGAAFSTAFTGNPARPTVATAGRLGDGSAIILLDFFTKAALYAVVDCAIVPSRNAQGEQYSFGEHGYSAFGDGVGCPAIGVSGRQLVGYRVEKKQDGYTVHRTRINLSGGGSRAQNGATTQVGSGLSGRSTTVRTALKGVSCGTAAGVSEPSGTSKE